jgi:hypothetical protein
MTIDYREDWTRLYLGAGRDGALLEVATVTREQEPEMAIHAMKMRPKYRQILFGERQ